MELKNKYFVRPRIYESKFREFVKYFALDIDAHRIAILCGLNRNTVNKYIMLLRIRIAEHCEQDPAFQGLVEMDESYFGPRRARGIRGRGANKKTPVFGILERASRVYARVVPNCSRKVIHAIIEGKVDKESTIHSDSYSIYDGLVDLGFQKHYRIRHGDIQFADGSNHINGIESFWSFAKRRLQKFCGIPEHTFYYHLKECELRFNHRKQNIYQVILKICREKPLNGKGSGELGEHWRESCEWHPQGYVALHDLS